MQIPSWSGDTQRAKFAEKVHKPPLGVNVNNIELKGLMHPYGSLGVPQTSKSHFNFQFLSSDFLFSIFDVRL